uniref:Putative transcriptional coactivator p15 n=1 Tax=Tabanus bromius TaxID=304241 RepID=A0A0K8TNQ4_TABBR
MPKHRSKSSSSSDSGPEDRTPVKKVKEADEKPEEKRWQIDKMRFVTINEFRGVRRADIREYYERDGKTCPGKKGISLTLPQFEKLGDAFEEIKKALAN